MLSLLYLFWKYFVPLNKQNSKNASSKAKSFAETIMKYFIKFKKHSFSGHKCGYRRPVYKDILSINMETVNKIKSFAEESIACKVHFKLQAKIN